MTRQTHVLGVIRITEGHVHVVGKKNLKSVLMEMRNWEMEMRGRSVLKNWRFFGPIWSSDADHRPFWLLISLNVSFFSTQTSMQQHYF